MGRAAFNEAARRAQARQLGKETDAKALDSVKPTGKDPAAKTDRGQPAKGTQDTEAAGPKDTTEAQKAARATELDKSKKHLALDGWTEKELSRLTEDQLLEFGKDAQEQHAAKYREGAERAAAERSQPAKGTARPVGDAKPDDNSEYEAIAREHFAWAADEDGQFSKSIAGFGRSIEKRVNALVESRVKAAESEVVESLKEIRSLLADELHFELGSRDLRDSFPASTTPDGRKSLATRYAALRKHDPKLDPRTALDQAADSLWGADLRKADAERTQRITAARQGAHSDPANMTEAPKAPTFKSVATEAVRKHMLT
jgi:hypothetical protein